ncbi:hypothetical protein T484DRAFT_1608210, partial [Baffinella frigidus]
HLNPQPSTLNPQPSTLNPQPSTLNPQPSTLNPKLQTPNPQPSTLNPNPQTLNPSRSAPSSTASTAAPPLRSPSSPAQQPLTRGRPSSLTTRRSMHSCRHRSSPPRSFSLQLCRLFGEGLFSRGERTGFVPSPTVPLQWYLAN